jgi:phage/plasmid-like protein (TIGR03299 family)
VPCGIIAGHFLCTAVNEKGKKRDMGHNINVTNGKASMMYVGEVPWHRLGTRLDRPATAAEAIEAAGLGFTVEKMALKTRDAELQVEGHFATVRTDTYEVLGVVGSRYSIIQNTDAFTTFDALVGEGEAIYHTAGVLGKGERIWLLAKLPDYIRVNGGDVVEKYLLLTNSHDGSGPVSVKLTPIRIVCENTLALALDGEEKEVRVRHTGQAKARLREAHEVLGLANQLYAQLDQVFNDMSRKHIDGKTLFGYVRAVFPSKSTLEDRSRIVRIREKVLELAETGKGAEISRGTVWGAYNAVTEFVDHYRLTSVTDTASLKSVWFGPGERIKRQAFKAAMIMLN